MPAPLPNVMRNSPASMPAPHESGTAKTASFEGSTGFTLIEAMVSLVILAVILLGLQAGMMTAITMNTENLMREEAVNVAQERMDRYRVEPGSPPGSETVSRQVRNFEVDYRLTNSYDASTNVLNITVEWDFQNEDHSLDYESHIGG